MELELDTFSLAEALENGLTMVRERAGHHGITLDLDVDPDVGLVEADERKVKQVLLNLLSNAVKFTPDGGPSTPRGLVDRWSRRSPSRDTGIGIAPAGPGAHLRGVPPGGRRRLPQAREGTGLGLALAKLRRAARRPPVGRERRVAGIDLHVHASREPPPSRAELILSSVEDNDNNRSCLVRDVLQAERLPPRRRG